MSTGRRVDAEIERAERAIARANLERAATELMQLTRARSYPAAVSVEGLRRAAEHAGMAIKALRTIEPVRPTNDPTVVWVRDPLRRGQR
jgi:hypothetical protein